uniref:F-box domain-containing protein n=1 Tax=Caenorhabditis tropicalis TaxID=1561998 RepID=A0A1I7UE93_9PELO
MVSWSCLPPEIKQHVVKKLDFMSRHSLRHTSRLDRKIVDSTKCQVPRVRFGYKEGRGLIVVYTGIDQFLRIEMEEKKGGALITKFENSFDPETARPPFLLKYNPETLNFIILLQVTYHFLLISSKIHIKVLEIEIPELAANDPVRELLDGAARTTVALGQVDELVFSGITDDEILDHVEASAKKCKTSCLQLMISNENISPVMSYDEVLVTRYGFFTCTTLSTELVAPGSPNIDFFYNRRCQERFKNKEHGFLTCSLRNLNNRNPKECSRKTFGDLLQWSKTTECGEIRHTIQKIHEEDCKQQFFPIEYPETSTKCGLGDLCKRCSDPFDYWYTQNLPRRLYFEPFWDAIISRNVTGKDHEYEIRMIKLKIAKEEKEMQRIRKIVEKKKGKNQVASWGFGKEQRGWEPYVVASIMRDCFEIQILNEIGLEKWPTLSMSDSEKEKLAKFFGNGRDPEKVADSIYKKMQERYSERTKPLETVENKEKESDIGDTVTLESEQPPNLEVEKVEEEKDTNRRLKLLAIIFLSPIILSFVFSFFFELKW